MKSLQEKAEAGRACAIYVHVPFCSTPYDFCAFYEKKPARGEFSSFVAGIEGELNLVPIEGEVATIYWGGGTPSLLPIPQLETLGRVLLERISNRPVEWTVEMTPASVKPDKISILKDLGVNRISLGVQSFSERLLAVLGREHSPREVCRAIEIINVGGIENVNLDLMFAVPGQTLSMWEADLREAVGLGPDHLSTYCLTYEEETALFLKLLRGRLAPMSELEEAAYYESTWNLLEEAGYRQYEIANFSRNGLECLHNKNTWRMGEWIGLGPSASSQYGARRYTNIASLAEWRAGIDCQRPARVDQVELTPDILVTDSLIFGLRMNSGVDLCALQDRFPSIDFIPLRTLWERLGGEDLVENRGDDRLRLTQKGRLLADRIAVEILDILEGVTTKRKP